MIRINSFQLKLFACGTMLIDHIGAALFPEWIILRIIGRLSFPVFAFLIAEGVRHTKNTEKYLMRLIGYGFLAQYPFYMAFRHEGYYNVLFTLALSVLGILLSQRIKDSKYQSFSPLAIFIMAVLAGVINTDWGAFGVILPYLFYEFRGEHGKFILSSILLTLVFDGNTLLNLYNNGQLSMAVFFRVSIHAIWFLSLIPIFNYNEERGPNLFSIKHAFYLFYPLHLFILGLLR